MNIEKLTIVPWGKDDRQARNSRWGQRWCIQSSKFTCCGRLRGDLCAKIMEICHEAGRISLVLISPKYGRDESPQSIKKRVRPRSEVEHGFGGYILRGWMGTASELSEPAGLCRGWDGGLYVWFRDLRRARNFVWLLQLLGKVCKQDNKLKRSTSVVTDHSSERCRRKSDMVWLAWCARLS